MKRPLLAIGLTVLLTLAGVSFFPAGAAFSCGGAGLVCFTALFFIRPSRARQITSLFVLSFSLACLWYAAYTNWVYEPAAALDGQTLTVSGTVEDAESRENGRFSYTLKVRSVAGEDGRTEGLPQSLRLLLYTSESFEALPGDRVRVQAFLRVPSVSAGFDGVRYYKGKGIFLTGLARGAPTVEERAHPGILAQTARLRTAITSNLRIALPGDRGGLAIGMLTGNKSFLSDTARRAFSRSGIQHILAVSGLHLTILIGFLAVMLRPVQKRAKNLILIVLTLLFMAFESFTPSVTRAGIMLITCFAAGLFRRTADSPTSVGLAALLLCAANPYAAMDVGLQLSISSVLAILFWARALTGKYKALFKHVGLHGKTAGRICSVLGVSTAASLATFPLTALHFGAVSLLAPLSNLLLCTLIPVLLCVYFAAALLSLIPLPFVTTKILFWLAGTLGDLFLGIVHLLSKLPFAMLGENAQPFLLCAAAAASVILLIRRFVLHPDWKHPLMLLTGMACLSGMLCMWIQTAGTVRMVFPNDRSVTTAVLYDTDGRVTVIVGDCSPNIAGNLLYYLNRSEIGQIENAVFIGGTKKNMEAAALLLQGFPVRRAFIDGETRAAEIVGPSLLQAKEVYDLSKTVIALSSGDTLAAQRDAEGGLMLRLSLRGTSVLILPEGCAFGGGLEEPDLLLFSGASQSGTQFIQPQTVVLPSDSNFNIETGAAILESSRLIRLDAQAQLRVSFRKDGPPVFSARP